MSVSDPAPSGRPPLVSRSPDHVQLSLAAAMVLGLRPGRFMRGGVTHCLNLLLTYPGGCASNCAYCGLARERQGDAAEKSFIRVEWPTVSLDDIIARSVTRTDTLERMCISMITHPRAQRDTVEILRRWKREPRLDSVPVSILCNPSTMDRADLEELADAGAERFTVALDAVTEPIFETTRGRGVRGPNRWDKYWEIYQQAFEVFGRDKVGVHLICGMGETERQMVETMARARALGEYGCLQLFAFNPEEGSAMDEVERVPLGQFRRVQLARYLLDKDLVGLDDLDFNHRGQIVGFGLAGRRLRGIVALGTPFRTSGCPGRECDVSACNRPFGDGPPTDFSSFPFPPSDWDLDNVRVQLADYEGLIRREDVSAAVLAELERSEGLPCRG